jgi:Protein of unknown function (DUF2934)
VAVRFAGLAARIKFNKRSKPSTAVLIGTRYVTSRPPLATAIRITPNSRVVGSELPIPPVERVKEEWIDLGSEPCWPPTCMDKDHMSADITPSPYYAMQLPGPEFGNTHHRAIAEAAYFRAERRGFVPGHELDDWLAAETEIKERLMS